MMEPVSTSYAAEDFISTVRTFRDKFFWKKALFANVREKFVELWKR
jgi:hypothetical protein